MKIKHAIFVFLAVLLIGCGNKQQVAWITDVSGRQHCKDLQTGQYVEDDRCDKEKLLNQGR